MSTFQTGNWGFIKDMKFYKAHGWVSIGRWDKNLRNSGSKPVILSSVQRRKKPLFYRPSSVLSYQQMDGIFCFMPHLGTTQTNSIKCKVIYLL